MHWTSSVVLLALSVGKTKDHKIGMCCCSAKHTALRNNIKDWLARSDMSNSGLLIQWTWVCWFNSKQTSSSYLWNVNCYCHDIAEIVYLVLNNNYSLLLPFMQYYSKSFVFVIDSLIVWVKSLDGLEYIYLARTVILLDVINIFLSVLKIYR